MEDIFSADRVERVAALRSSGIEPYPARVPKNRMLAAEILALGEKNYGTEVRVSGRIMGRRGYGKLAFLDLVDGSGRIQICLQKEHLSDENFALLGQLNRGDFIFVEGEFKATDKGEPTVYGNSITLLAKSLLDPPEKRKGLEDPELRARLRYVDLFTDNEVQKRFLARSALTEAVRKELLSRCFVEVETPVLHPLYGGAFARPFTTHHQSLDMELFLRIAPELYLKRLLVGGIERVFEFARVFRNEGLSTRHNPEFTMLELYQAHTDYAGMIEIVEALVPAACLAAGNDKLTATWKNQTWSLEPPYPQKAYGELFLEHASCDIHNESAVHTALKEHNISVEGDDEGAWWKAVNDLFEATVEPTLQDPVFVIDYPAPVSPLAKVSPNDTNVAERFEFFLGGMELGNAFTELNDPEQQLANFEAQAVSSDPDSPRIIDRDYVRALAYGMPPAGGLGLGIDRLAMVILGCDTIREVLLFPHLRPEYGAEA
ncbi:MAG TPA: lysine--tRNA ligase [Planctomycetes bacterium]|nr:lysine--tRNA ligase [Planctomycetota bacterium]